MTYLLDTNVLSELHKANPDTRVRDWVGSNDPTMMFVSAMSLGEIRNGAERLLRRDPHQASIHLGWLGNLRLQFADRVLPVTGPIAEEWGRLDASRGPLPIVDALIAATARVHGLTVVTRNEADFRRADVSVLNPFTG